MALVTYALLLVLSGFVIRYFFPYLAALRAPLICGVIFAAFPYIANRGSLKAMGHGMFEVGRWDIWQITLAVLTAAGTLLTCTDLIASYAGERSGLMPLPAYLGKDVIVWPVRLSRLSVGLGLVYLAGAIYYLALLKPRAGWDAAAAGEVLLGLVVFLIGVAALWFLVDHNPFHSAAKRLLLLLATPNGYVDPAGKIYAGHFISAVSAGLFTIAYLWFGWTRYLHIQSNPVVAVGDAEKAVTVPTLAWVVFLVIIACSVLSGLSFWLDSRRIPLLLPLGVLVTLCGWLFPSSDHTFPAPAGNLRPEAPGELIQKLPPGADPNAIVIVAASGGGIQAAAWTAAVLEGLVKEMPGRFAKQVRLVSGVSGGSVGLMYFNAAYRNGDIPHAELTRAVLGAGGGEDPLFRLASAPSLDFVAWGLAFPDFFRSWIPILFPQPVDRAWALERAWVRYAGMEGLRSAKLSDWARDANLGVRPPAVFNSTLAETGSRYLLATFRLNKPLFGRLQYVSELPDRDLAVSTAARQSAAFPYVSPASRPDFQSEDSPHGHLVDGGYYDNYGIASSVDYLLEALPDATGKRILLIQIEAGLFGEKKLERIPYGWFYQLLAPAQGLLGVWDTGMRSRNEVEIALLKEVVRRRGAELHSLRVDFPDPVTPLSWYLTREDKNHIRRAWDVTRGPKTIAAVRRFLDGAAPPSYDFNKENQDWQLETTQQSKK